MTIIKLFIATIVLYPIILGYTLATFIQPGFLGRYLRYFPKQKESRVLLLTLFFFYSLWLGLLTYLMRMLNDQILL